METLYLVSRSTMLLSTLLEVSIWMCDKAEKPVEPSKTSFKAKQMQGKISEVLGGLKLIKNV